MLANPLAQNCRSLTNRGTHLRRYFSQEKGRVEILTALAQNIFRLGHFTRIKSFVWEVLYLFLKEVYTPVSKKHIQYKNNFLQLIKRTASFPEKVSKLSFRIQCYTRMHLPCTESPIAPRSMKRIQISVRNYG